MKQLSKFLTESLQSNDIMTSAHKINNIPYSVLKIFEYIFNTMLNNGWDLESDKAKRVLHAIIDNVYDVIASREALRLVRKLQAGGQLILSTIDDLTRYNDEKDVLVDCGDTYYFGDSKGYIEITSANPDEYYAKGFRKPYPKNILNLYDYKMVKKNKYEFVEND